MRLAVSTAIFLTCLFLCACAAATVDGAATTDSEKQRIDFAGQIVFVPLEGGFYGLESSTGEKFDPVNLPEEFRCDGLRVRVKACLLPRSIGVHMWGAKIEIIAIERI